MIDGCPAKRAGTPDEVGNVAALLMGTEGAFITGCDFLMDGGVTHPIGSESWLRSDRTSQCGSPCLFGHPGKDRDGRSGHPHWAEGVPSFIPDWWKMARRGR
jgi:Enoyl-(Acyl carrier protein) reductase